MAGGQEAAMIDPAPSEADRYHHDHVDPHRPGSRLVEVVLGGQDGLVNVLGVVLGVAAAGAGSRLVLAAGLAATFAESVSMAAVAYTSALTRGELYESERARELRHLRAVPALERDEVRTLFRRKGFRGELLERIVETIAADKEVWVELMMAEEHHLAPASRARALRDALAVGASAFVGSLVPLAPFLVASPELASMLSIALSAVVLFAFGAYKARRTIGRTFRSGLELAAIGVASALAGYLAGRLFGVSSA
jgi:vacuolar iron transporter family protein